MRRPRRRAQRQATERVNPVTKISDHSFRPLNAGGDSAARCPYRFCNEPALEFGLKSHGIALRSSWTTRTWDVVGLMRNARRKPSRSSKMISLASAVPSG